MEISEAVVLTISRKRTVWKSDECGSLDESKHGGVVGCLVLYSIEQNSNKHSFV